MRQFLASVGRFLAEEDGPTGVEYAVMGVAVMVAVIGTVTIIGGQAKALFETSRNAM
jgi:pilus assembly protein Flp/PilA